MPATPRNGLWAVTHVEVTEPTSTTALRGRALLLGGGARAFCDNGSASAVLTIAVHDGRLVCTGIDVRELARRGGVSSAGLHRIPVSRLMREAFASLDADDWTAQRAVDAYGRMEAVVTAWCAAQTGSDAHRATAAVAEQLSLSRGYVSRLLTRARREGLLPR